MDLRLLCLRERHLVERVEELEKSQEQSDAREKRAVRQSEIRNQREMTKVKQDAEKR